MSKSISLLKGKPTLILENSNNTNPNATSTSNNMFLILNRSIEETVSKFTQKYFNITTLLNEMHSEFLSQMKLLSDKVLTQFNQPIHNTNPNMTSPTSIPFNSPTSTSHINYFNVNRSVKYNPLSTTTSSSYKNMPFYHPKESLQSVSVSEITNRKKTPSQANLTHKSTSINKKAKKAQNDESNISKYLNTNPNTHHKYNNALNG